MKNVIYLLLAGIALVSCRIDDEPQERIGPLNIVTTTGIIEDGVLNIVGSDCEVTALMGPGTDPHIYKPTPGDVEILDEADVIVANGLHLEGKMAEMLTKYSKEKPVILVSDGIKEKDIIKSADFEDAHDPHIWFDCNKWLDGLTHVATELGKIEPELDSTFKLNLSEYKKEVKTVDKWVKRQIGDLDPDSRVLVTSHDAFSYFGERFGLEVKGIQGISTLSEVGLKEIADMVDFVIDRKLKAIFVETSTSSKTAQSIVEGCKDKGYSVDLAGPLYSDALGEPDSDAGTYIGMIKANVTTIVEGLK
ncbi:MAG: manganese/zinc/iron transport system substrate-binding protein [Arenicella sp.]|jgi:manganese/zinc/iron transport system substrate-binding protein